MLHAEADLVKELRKRRLTIAKRWLARHVTAAADEEEGGTAVACEDDGSPLPVLPRLPL